jgi:hypothetical protein
VAEPLRLTAGGWFQRLERRAHLEPLRRQVALAIAITWAPLPVLALLESLLGRPDRLLRDLSIHARLLVALPMFLAASRWLDRGCGIALKRLDEEGFVGAPERSRVRALLDRIDRVRGSVWTDTLLLGAALVIGIGALSGWLPPAGLIHGVSVSRFSAVRVWYALVSLPLSQFIVLRALLHWALWIRFLAGIARLPLRLVPWHADRRGGIGFLKVPSLVYSAMVLFAASSMLCAGWGTQIILEGAKIQAFRPLLYLSVIVGAVLAFGPLLTFVPLLVKERERGRIEFGTLVTDYARAFGQRWMHGDRRDLLGNPDMQSLNDISGSFRENVDGMVPILFTVRDAILLLVVSQLPVLPLIFTALPAREVLGRLLKLLGGGIAG